MTTADILWIAAIHILLFAMMFTLQKINEFKTKSIISKKQALLYIFVTFILPLLSLVLIVVLTKKDRNKMADLEN